MEPSSTITWTVLIPTHDHGRLLACSVESLRRQTVQDFEVYMIGDGASDETREVARKLASEDSRIRFVEREKSPRTGEPYRHEVLQQARGRLVAYLSDDDLWLPHHLEAMGEVLREADLANGFMLRLHVDGRVTPFVCDLSRPLFIERQCDLRKEKNYMPLSSVAHRLDAYHRLPHGWRTTPAGTPTDLHMWRQWFATPGMRFASSDRVSVLNFPDGERRGAALDREAELAGWLERMETPGGLRDLHERTIRALRREALRGKNRAPRTLRNLFGLLGRR